MKKLLCFFIVLLMASTTLFSANFAFAETSTIDTISFKDLAENVKRSHTTLFFDESVFDNLDTGIYWYGADLSLIKAEYGENANFDNEKPTIIFVHGWQQNQGYKSREILYYDEVYPFAVSNKFVATDWLNKGYNVGMFYWNQLADDSLENAIQKIYTTETTGMRYRKADGTYTEKTDRSNPDITVAELFVKSYLACMKNYEGHGITLVGHSMGAHVVTVATEILLNHFSHKKQLIPSRISLIDPYSYMPIKENFTINWSNETLNDKCIWEVCCDYIEDISDKGIAFDIYGSMDLAFNMCYNLSKMKTPIYIDNAEERIKLAYDKMFNSSMFVYLDGLKNLSAYKNEIGSEHVGARDWYFSLFSTSVPIFYYKNDVKIGTTSVAPNANAFTIYALKGKTFVQCYNKNANYYSEVLPYTKEFIDDVEVFPNIISGRVFVDTNNDNHIDNVTTGMLENVTVSLLNERDEIVATALTDNNGYYKFTNIESGNYKIHIDKDKKQNYAINSRWSNSAFVSKVKKGGYTDAIKVSSGSIVTVNLGLSYVLFLFGILFVVFVIVSTSIVVVCEILKIKKREKIPNFGK